MARTKDSPQILELRHRLLHAAGEVFAEHGFQVATVRQITERAGVNIAAVNYHFRDKAELYACALLEASAKASQSPLPSPDGPPAARLRAFVASMLTYLLDPTRPAWQSQLIAREMAEPTPALDRVVEESMRPRCDCLLAILSAAAGTPLPREKLILLGNSVIGQCLHYAHKGPVIDRLFPELSGYAQRIDLLAEHITDFTLPGVQKAGRDAKRKLPIS